MINVDAAAFGIVAGVIHEQYMVESGDNRLHETYPDRFTLDDVMRFTGIIAIEAVFSALKDCGVQIDASTTRFTEALKEFYEASSNRPNVVLHSPVIYR